MWRLYSPTEITNDVKRVLARLKTKNTPQQIPIRPENDCIPGSCFYNVERKVGRDRGKSRFGWAILQGSFICEAEHHAIWESDEGELVDVTPREDEMKEIMFVSDNDLVFQGNAIDNVRINVLGDPMVDDFIRIAETLSVALSKGVRVSELETRYSVNVGKIIGYLIETKNLYVRHLESGGRFTTECFCKKGKAYKNCHRHGNLNLLRQYSDALNML